MQPARVVDLLILTALREEYDQVLTVEVGAFLGSSWQVRPRPLGHEMAFRVFAAENGQPLSVAVEGDDDDDDDDDDEAAEEEREE